MGKRLVLLMIFLDLPLMFINYGLMWIGAGPEFVIDGLEPLAEVAAPAWLATMLALPILILVYNFWHRDGAKGLAVFGAVLFLFAASVAIYGMRLGAITAEQTVPERQTLVSGRYLWLGSFDFAEERLDERDKTYLEERGRRTYMQAAAELRWEVLPDIDPELLERENLLAEAAEFEGLLDPAHPELGYAVVAEQQLPKWKPGEVFRQFMQGFVELPERQAEYERRWRQERALAVRNALQLGGLTFTEAEELYQAQLAAALWPESGEGWLGAQLAGYDGELRLVDPEKLGADRRQSVWVLADEEAGLLGASYPGLYQAELVRWEPIEGEKMPQGSITKLMQGEEPEGVRPVERLRILFHMDDNYAYEGRNYTNARYIGVLHEDY